MVLNRFNGGPQAFGGSFAASVNDVSHHEQRPKLPAILHEPLRVRT